MGNRHTTSIVKVTGSTRGLYRTGRSTRNSTSAVLTQKVGSVVTCFPSVLCIMTSLLDTSTSFSMGILRVYVLKSLRLCHAVRSYMRLCLRCHGNFLTLFKEREQDVASYDYTRSKNPYSKCNLYFPCISVALCSIEHCSFVSATFSRML
jgi:hypothetical protein